MFFGQRSRQAFSALMLRFMTHYRFPLLLAIATVYWNVAIPGDKAPLGLNSNVLAARETIIAQSKDFAIEGAKYDLQMQKGYQAAKDKDYSAALAAFQKALEERPNDRYAQQAVQNIQSYLDRAKQFWLLVTLGAVALVGIGTSLLFFFLLQKRRSPAQPIDSSDNNYVDNVPMQAKAEALAEGESDNHIPESHNHNVNHLDNDGDVPNTTESAEAVSNTVESAEIQESGVRLQHISRIPSSDEVQDLVSDLKNSDPKIRRKAIWDLAQNSDSRAMKPLVALMIDTDSQERSLILEALSQISTRTLKPMNQALAVSLQDQNPQVRKNAIRDLTRIYDLMSQISQMLCHAIDDGDSDVKETAKWALNQINLQMPPRFELLSTPQTPEVSVEQSYSESTEI